MESYRNKKLEKYDISSNGFITDVSLETLVNTNDVIKQYHEVCLQLPIINKSYGVEEAVNNLPDYPINNIHSSNEYKLTYLIFSFLTQSYVWCSGEGIIHNEIPDKLAIPLTQAATYLGIAPILTHATVDLYNWVSSEEKITLSSLKSLYTFTGLDSENWFYMVTTAIEKLVSELLVTTINLIYLIRNGIEINNTEIDDLLSELVKCTGEFTDIFKELFQKCESKDFFYKLRLFLGGWKHREDPHPLSKGLIYGSVHGGKPQEYYGGSAAQSTTIQFIDTIVGNYPTDPYYYEIRGYMPIRHAKFLDYVKKYINLSTLTKETGCDSIIHKYNTVLTNMARFRQFHRGIVHSHIVKNVVNEHPDIDIRQIDGTGGTKMLDFLDTRIEETEKIEIVKHNRTKKNIEIFLYLIVLAFAVILWQLY